MNAKNARCRHCFQPLPEGGDICGDCVTYDIGVSAAVSILDANNVEDSQMRAVLGAEIVRSYIRRNFN